ncbi:caspase family protein [Larkinella punicea]|uniref:Caspase family protein n=1 Tax=Larkinella punicea TaxID=2315727 RepID=A0A368JYF7_9BACT|nr:caspase family protein [Larkinella punicea]RCR71261.1 caspase family protein [Larkinella punicea]
MSLVFEKTDFQPNQPQTHAFVIGVGAYRHLPEGDLYNTKPAPFTMGLGQLTSPPISAKAFTDWLISTHRNLDAPLGSIELLISPAGQYKSPNGNNIPVEAATFSNIADAFDRWVARCDESKQNVALFFFCGHGLDYMTTTLLTEDFGASSGRPWENAIDFTTTYTGMIDCQAETQIFFLDACREANKESLKSEGYKPRPLKTSQKTQFPPRAAPIFKSSLQGGTADAIQEEVSFFTQELIRTLNNFGAEDQVEDFWRVTPESLSKGLMNALRWQDRFCSVEGELQIPNKVIHQIPDPVLCRVKVTCSPPERHQAARLIMTQRLVDLPKVYSRNPSIEPWTEEVESGVYRVEAQFDSGIFPRMENPKFIVFPPERNCPLH